MPVFTVDMKAKMAFDILCTDVVYLTFSLPQQGTEMLSHVISDLE